MQSSPLIPGCCLWPQAVSSSLGGHPPPHSPSHKPLLVTDHISVPVDFPVWEISFQQNDILRGHCFPVSHRKHVSQAHLWHSLARAGELWSTWYKPETLGKRGPRMRASLLLNCGHVWFISFLVLLVLSNKSFLDRLAFYLLFCLCYFCPSCLEFSLLLSFYRLVEFSCILTWVFRTKNPLCLLTFVHPSVLEYNHFIFTHPKLFSNLSCEFWIFLFMLFYLCILLNLQVSCYWLLILKFNPFIFTETYFMTTICLDEFLKHIFCVHLMCIHSS